MVAPAPSPHTQKTLGCPGCNSPLKLIPQLHGRQIVCNKCDKILAVSAEPWGLCILAPRSGQSPAGEGRTRTFLAETVAGRPCPRCRNRMHLVPQLHGRRIRCKKCQTVLAVSSAPWSLAIVEPLTLKSREGGAPGDEPGTLEDRLTRGAPWGESQSTTAQEEPVTELSVLQIAMYACVAVVVVGLAVGGWSMLPERGPTRPAAVNFPKDCVTLVSIKPYEVPDWRTRANFPGWQPFIVADWCAAYCAKTETILNQLDRVTAGNSPSSVAWVLHYHYKNPLNQTEFLSRKGLGTWESFKLAHETIRGVEMWTLGPTGFAFPDQSTVATTEKEMLADSLHNSWGRINKRMGRLLESVDFNKTAVCIQFGIPPPVAGAHLADNPALLDRFDGTVDEHEFGGRWSLKRTFHAMDAAAAQGLCVAIKGKLSVTCQDPHTPPAVVTVLRSIQVNTADTTVTIQLNVDREDVSKKVAQALVPYF